MSLDEIADPDDLALSCLLNDATVQSARTSEMIFSVPALIAHITSVCPLFPGDLIFTGTPAGVGNRREVSTVEGLGTMRHQFDRSRSAERDRSSRRGSPLVG